MESAWTISYDDFQVKADSGQTQGSAEVSSSSLSRLKSANLGATSQVWSFRTRSFCLAK